MTVSIAFSTGALLRSRWILTGLLLLFGARGASLAEERLLPTPRVTIYPGDHIYDNLLEERGFSFEIAPSGAGIESREAIVGKVARRTLLPGKPIPAIAIDNPKIVAIGAQVRIVFAESGLEITAYGMAMQAGAVGDLIRVRNQDSGLTVSGRVRRDGSVQICEG